MSEKVISVKGLGKKYRLGATLSPNTLRDHIVEGAKGLLGKKGQAEGPEDFWALRNIDVDINQGEVVGVIGRNGAGKTTLLKILSEITEPTEGEVRLRGRVSSLLEVGTGFHPELSGRENVYLNGAILGMTKAEIKRKFNEIVEFAGVSKFIDTPVKRYSSGMYVRLAFAVAAHLESEILLIDEVLAVGDAEFQKKCIDKMGDVVKGGRTILFVSHNMAAVDLLCPRCILLKDGTVSAIGDTSEIIENYIGHGGEMKGDWDLELNKTRPKDLQPIMRRFKVINSQGDTCKNIHVGDSARFIVEGHTGSPMTGVTLGFRIARITGERVATCLSSYQHPDSISLNGDFKIECEMKNCRLVPGQYKMMLVMKSDTGLADQVEDIDLEITERDIDGTGRILPARTGAYLPETKWVIE